MPNTKTGLIIRPSKWLSLNKQNQTQENSSNKILEPLPFQRTSKSKFANNFVQNVQEKPLPKDLKPIDLQNRNQSRQSRQSRRESLGPLAITSNSQQETLHRSRSIRRNTFRLKTLFNHQISEVQFQLNIVLDFLKTNNILSSNHMKTFTIKKEDFVQLLSKIINLSIHQASPIYVENLDNFAYLNPALNEIKKLLKTEDSTFRVKSFVFTPVKPFTWTSEIYEKELYTIETHLQKLLKKKQLIETNLTQLQLKKNYLQNNNNQITQDTEKLARDYHELYQKNREEEDKRSKLLQEIKNLEEKLAHVLETSQKIFTFAGDQNNNKLVKDASEHYLEIESEIYDYAAYLQSNSLANKLGYEPYPFDQLTKDIEGKMKKLNKTLIQDEDFSIKDKERFMRDFLMESIEKYRKKDEEQWKMIIFRGQCVRNFIQKMQHLLENWELKQEYLKNLRNEFAFDSENLVKQLGTLEELPLCEFCKPKVFPKKAKLLFLYQKVEHIYKMGNSFY